MKRIQRFRLYKIALFARDSPDSLKTFSGTRAKYFAKQNARHSVDGVRVVIEDNDDNTVLCANEILRYGQTREQISPPS